MAKEGVQAFRMVIQSFNAAPVGHADYQGKIALSPGTVAHAGYVGDDLVEGWIGKTGKLDFGYRLETIDGHAHCRAHNGCFSNGCVKAALRPVLFLQAHS